MESLYLLALQRENEMMDIQLKNKEYSDTALLSKLQERQTSVLEEVISLKSRFEEYDSTKDDLLARIAKLEKENQKERDHSIYLQQQLDQQKQHIADEEEDDDDDEYQIRAPNAANHGQLPTKKGRNVDKACNHCKRSHLRCDDMRPCRRCVATGKQGCKDVQHKPRGRPKLHKKLTK